jgi:hypothetical protein
VFVASLLFGFLEDFLGLDAAVGVALAVGTGIGEKSHRGERESQILNQNNRSKNKCVTLPYIIMSHTSIDHPPTLPHPTIIPL